MAVPQEVKFPPERIGEAQITTLAATTDTRINLIQNFRPRLLTVDSLSAVGNDTVTLVLRQDGRDLELIHSQSMLGFVGDDLLATRFPDVPNIVSFELLGRNSAGAVTNYPTRHSFIVSPITIAEKLKFNVALNPEEQRTVTKLLERGIDVRQMVRFGLLPIPFPQFVEKLYPVIKREIRGFRVTVPTTGSEALTVVPEKDTAIILEKIAADVALATDSVIIDVNRDNDTNYLALNGAAMRIEEPMPVFIPATSNLSIDINAGVAQTDYRLRATFSRIRLTIPMRVRWGLELSTSEQKEVDEQLIREKVLVGLL